MTQPETNWSFPHLAPEQLGELTGLLRRVAAVKAREIDDYLTQRAQSRGLTLAQYKLTTDYGLFLADMTKVFSDAYQGEES